MITYNNKQIINVTTYSDMERMVIVMVMVIVTE